MGSTIQNGYNIKLDIFEGPMDLLLHLIKKAKIDIWDIPIALITEQYLEHIRIMQDLNLDIAGDFLSMASYLMYLKSRSLLSPFDDEEEDPEEARRRLAERLIEYQVIKQGAEVLALLKTEREKSIPAAGMPIPDREELIEADLFDLLSVYYSMVKETLATPRVHNITIDPLAIQEEMSRILSIICVKKKTFFRLLFIESDFNSFIISFLSILELTRIHSVKISQAQLFGDILVVQS